VPNRNGVWRTALCTPCSESRSCVCCVHHTKFVELNVAIHDSLDHHILHPITVGLNLIHEFGFIFGVPKCITVAVTDSFNDVEFDNFNFFKFDSFNFVSSNNFNCPNQSGLCDLWCDTECECNCCVRDSKIFEQIRVQAICETRNG